MAEPNDRARGAAAFLAEALDLPDEPALLALDLVAVAVATEALVDTFAVELDSSIGPAAFLVYAYDLAATDGEGLDGEARFAADIETLARAAALDAPGPRVVAHARSDTAGYVLATSPATLRAWTGQGDATAGAVSGEEELAPADSTEIRSTAAAELLRLLRSANEQASHWAAGWAAAGADRDRPPLFSPEETELALFLLDPGSIQPLLGALDTLLTAARARPSPDDDRSGS